MTKFERQISLEKFLPITFHLLKSNMFLRPDRNFASLRGERAVLRIFADKSSERRSPAFPLGLFLSHLFHLAFQISKSSFRPECSSSSTRTQILNRFRRVQQFRPPGQRWLLLNGQLVIELGTPFEGIVSVLEHRFGPLHKIVFELASSSSAFGFHVSVDGRNSSLEFASCC